jgi:nucleoside-diphosphate-sugar epimerase
VTAAARLVVVGSGFIGSAVARGALARGVDVRIAHAPRLAPNQLSETSDWVRDTQRDDPASWRALVETLATATCVVNAAGFAEASSTDEPRMRAANVGTAVAVAAAAAEANVPRLVHVSTAAVQGSTDPLDDREHRTPFSAYSRSKAEAEQVLLSGDVAVPGSCVIYRPTSVQGAARPMTRALVRWFSAPLFPVLDPDRPLPLALVESVADAIVHLALVDRPPLVAVHPWEGLTIGSALATLGSNPRTVRLPLRADSVRRLLTRWHSARGAAVARRLSLVLLGQGVDARALPASGWTPSVLPDDYARLRRDVLDARRPHAL